MISVCIPVYNTEVDIDSLVLSIHDVEWNVEGDEKYGYYYNSGFSAFLF